jgi:hypothetical protein
MRTIFDTLNDAYEKYYNASKHLAIDEIIVIFKGRVVFRQYIPKKHVLESRSSRSVTQLDMLTP